MAEPTYFETPEAFRAWLSANHESQTELLVGFHKVDTGKASITWPQSVEEALTFGWIDGVRKSLGPEGYTIRFTPRKPTSIWSSVNITMAERLIAEGRMTPAGQAAFDLRKAHRSSIYSYEKAAVKMPEEYLSQLRQSEVAWTFYQALSPGNKKLATHRVVDAKQETTRQRRIEKLIRDCEAGRKPNVMG